MLQKRGLELDAALSYDLPLEEIVSRLSGRRTCLGCDAVFHLVSRPPRTPEVCDRCGQSLVQREDDRPESIRVRLASYEKDTAPVAEFYRRRNQLINIPAEGTPEEVFDVTVAALLTVVGVEQALQRRGTKVEMARAAPPWRNGPAAPEFPVRTISFSYSSMLSC